MGQQILIVDDDDLIRESLKINLAAFGFDVLEASNGKDAYRIIETENIDLVLLDSVISDMDAFEVCQKIKLLEKYKSLPIIILSSLNNNDAINQAARYGVVDSLAKPISLPLLSKKISGALKLEESSFTEFADLNNSLGKITWEYDLQKKSVQLSELFKMAFDYELNKGVSLAELFSLFPGKVQKKLEKQIKTTLEHGLAQPFRFSIEQMNHNKLTFKHSVKLIDRNKREYLMGCLTPFNPADEPINTNKKSDPKLIVNELKKAIKEKTFDLYYDAFFNKHSERIEGIIGPSYYLSASGNRVEFNKFSEIARSEKINKALGRLILNTAFQQLKLIQSNGYSGTRLTICLSKSQIIENDIVKFIVDVGRHFSISSTKVDIKIAEEFMSKYENNCKEILKMLKKLGIRGSIDNYWVGDSDHKSLKSLPLVIYRIDRTTLKNHKQRKKYDKLFSTVISLEEETLRKQYHEDSDPDYDELPVFSKLTHH